MFGIEKARAEIQLLHRALESARVDIDDVKIQLNKVHEGMIELNDSVNALLDRFEAYTKKETRVKKK